MLWIVAIIICIIAVILLIVAAVNLVKGYKEDQDLNDFVEKLSWEINGLSLNVYKLDKRYTNLEETHKQMQEELDNLFDEVNGIRTDILYLNRADDDLQGEIDYVKNELRYDFER